jgi:hypothetical protein
MPVSTRKTDSRPKVGSNPRQKEIRLSGKSFRLASRSILESALISKELRHEQLDDGLHYDGAVPGEQSSFGPAKRDGKMRQVLRSAAVVAVFAFISVSVAKADGSPELYYSLTGPGGATASFYLPVNPVIAPENVEPGFGFQVTPIDLMVDGSGDPGGYVMFYDVTQGGGLAIDQGDIFDLINPDGSNISLFTSGTEAAPNMLDVAGNIPLQDYLSSADGYNLTITSSVATPEPTSLLLIGAGMVALLFAKRRLAVS